MTPVTVRRLQPADAAAFQALRLQGLREWPTAFASSHEEEVDTPMESVQQRLQAHGDGAIFGAWLDSRMVGVVGIQREALRKLNHKAHLWGLYVAPEARGTGVAAALMDAALNHAWQTLGARQVNLGVNTRNDAALRLYRRLGFVVFGTERASLRVDGQLQDEHHMVCLSPEARRAAAPAPGMALKAWDSLDTTTQDQVLALRIEAAQVEFAGTVERAVEACQAHGGDERVALAALKGAQVVGFLVLMRGSHSPAWSQPGWAVLSAMRVDLSLQGQGLGPRMLQAAKAWVRDHWPDCDHLALSVDESNLPARRAYAKAGFADLGRRELGRIGWVRYLQAPLAAP